MHDGLKMNILLSKYVSFRQLLIVLHCAEWSTQQHTAHNSHLKWYRRNIRNDFCFFFKSLTIDDDKGLPSIHLRITRHKINRRHKINVYKNRRTACRIYTNTFILLIDDQNWLTYVHKYAFPLDVVNWKFSAD